jgi:hypothetical protein
VLVTPLLQILAVLIVVGVLLWLVNRFIPMQGTIKSILNAVVVIVVVLWLLNVFGLFHSLIQNPRWQLNEAYRRERKEGYGAAILVVGTKDKETRMSSERRRPCFGQFS